MFNSPGALLGGAFSGTEIEADDFRDGFSELSAVLRGGLKGRVVVAGDVAEEGAGEGFFEGAVVGEEDYVGLVVVDKLGGAVGGLVWRRGRRGGGSYNSAIFS